MARLNLTIPDPLYERLDRLRDRVNVSKICATALEQELAMLEGQLRPFHVQVHPHLAGATPVSHAIVVNREESGMTYAPTAAASSATGPVEIDPRYARLVERLQGARDRWHQRGRTDGEAWAIDSATREQLMWVATQMDRWDGLRLSREANPKELRVGDSPTIHIFESFRVADHLDRWVAEDAGVQEDLPTPEQQGQLARAREGLDEAAYLQGWRDAVRDVWLAVAPALR